jgi:hypothetical protein
MKKIVALAALFVVIACGGSGDHQTNSPMVAPVDQKTEQPAGNLHSNQITKTDAIPLIDKMDVLAAQINDGAMPYNVGDETDGYIETTTYYQDEEKTVPSMVKLIGVGSTTNVYFLDKSTSIVEQNNFVYIFNDDNLVYVMTDGEAITGISENNKNDITTTFLTALKIAQTPTQTVE